jgi:hypothetical protein
VALGEFTKKANLPSEATTSAAIEEVQLLAKRFTRREGRIKRTADERSMVATGLSRGAGEIAHESAER